MADVTRRLQEMLKRVQSWPENRQEDAVGLLEDMEAEDGSGLRLTAEQLAEVRRRRAKRDTNYVSLSDARDVVRKFGA